MPAKKTKTTDDYRYLVIVESPAKSKTLTKILGKDYLVKSSVGHIRDLPGKGLGIDVKNNFEPTYEIMSGKQKVVDDLNKYAKAAEKVYLASDPDREGEAIAWHLSHIIKAKKSNLERITFNQITPEAVKNAVANPRKIDQDLVNAQQARRILDRLVGYKISPILWRTIGGKSAGRVQSVALRLICEREEEINNFTPEEYWSLTASVHDSSIPVVKIPDDSFEVRLTHVDGRRVIAPLKEYDEAKNIVISSEEEIKKIQARIKDAIITVVALNTRPSTKKPKAPFKTSTMQRAASNALSYSVKKTMQVAQQLYEGVKLGSKSTDQVGLITYMRTDSLRIAPEAQEAAKEYILDKYGSPYYPDTPNQYDKSKKKANEQDAHEAIRPTYIDKDPDSIRKYLTDDQYRLYRLIWQRFVTSQMTDMKLEIKSLDIASATKDLMFKVSQSKVIFPGYSIVYGKAVEVNEDAEEKQENIKFPEYIKVGTQITTQDTIPAQHFTEGPSRYSEASLVKTLEELGIGRPSTYAPTISTIVDRNYAVKVNSGSGLGPTTLGVNVNKILVDHFGKFINVNFTSQMEADLDSVAHHKNDWRKMLTEFYKGDDAFEAIVKKAGKEVEKVNIETEYDCPKCSSKMLLKGSRNGPFLGCSNYPDCDAIVNLTKEGKPAPADRPYTEHNCPDCGQDTLVVRYGRYGDYIACINSNCKHTSPLVKKTGLDCPREGCTGHIVEKKSRFGKIFYGCDSWSKTQCDVVFWYPPIPDPKMRCPECGKVTVYKTLKRGDKIACSDTKGCGWNRIATVKEQEQLSPVINAKETTGESETKSVFSL